MVEATLTPERVQQMFCFQCEQTARGTGCTGKQGVCGKSAEVAGLEDQLTGAMIALSQGIVAGRERPGRHARPLHLHHQRRL